MIEKLEDGMIHGINPMVTRISYDSREKKIHYLKEGLQAMKERTKILRDTILQQDIVLKILGDMGVNSTTKLSCVKEKLDSLMRQHKKHTLVFQSSPLQEYLEKDCTTLSLNLHTREEVWYKGEGAKFSRWVLQVDQDQRLGWQYMVQCQYDEDDLQICDPRG